MLREAEALTELAVGVGASFIQVLSGPVQPGGAYRGPAGLSRAERREVTASALRAVARVVNQLPNRLTIAGHTSASSNGGRPASDWQLSAQRADASRALLQEAGVDPDRIYQVSGKAASDPLYPDDPTLAGNRRIALVLLREAPVLPPNH